MQYYDVVTSHLTKKNFAHELDVAINLLEHFPCDTHYRTVRRYHFWALENLDELPSNFYMWDNEIALVAIDKFILPKDHGIPIYVRYK